MRAAFITLLMAGLTGCSISAANATNEVSAEKAAQSWLALIDSGKYDQSWDATATIFQSATPKKAWANQVRSVRAMFGKVVSRKLKSATYTKTLPGAPDGNYVVIQYATKFEKKADAIETITPSMASDKRWRVSGYFIK